MQRQMVESVQKPISSVLLRIQESPFQAVRRALREVRSVLGQTQQDAYYDIGCSAHEYERWEYSRRVPSFPRAVDLLERELRAISQGLSMNLSITLMGRMFLETFEGDPEKFRYTLGRLATLAGQPRPVDEVASP